MNHIMQGDPRLRMLQIFADISPVQTTGLNAPGNDLSPEMKEYYRTQLLREAGPNLIHAQFAKHVPMPANNGDQASFRRFSNFKKATVPLKEGVTPEGSAVNVRQIHATVRQYGDYTPISDFLQLTAVDDMVVEITDRHAANMGLSLDTVARNEIHTCPNVFYAPKIGEDGKETEVKLRSELNRTCKLTPKLVARVAAFLKASNAPKIDGAYNWILHPYTEYDLLTSHDKWVDVVKYKDSQKVYLGEIGMLYGIRFCLTSEAKIHKGAKLTADAENLTAAAELSESSGSGTSSLSVSEAIQDGDRVLTASEESPVLLNVDGVEFECIGATKANAGSAKLTIQQPHAAIASGKTIYPGGAGENNEPVFANVCFGADAYGDINISGENAHVIVKPKGSGGTADPLEQRSTIGWKAAYAAKVLMEDYIVRIECCSELGEMVQEEN